MMVVSVEIVNASDSGAGLAAVQIQFREHCLDCHRSEDPAGNMDLMSLATDAPSADDPRWRRVLAVLRADEMPPPDTVQVVAGMREPLVDAISKWLRDTKPPGGSLQHVYARRLTRAEYTHALRDLLKLDTDPFILPEQFTTPDDYFDPSSGRMENRLFVQHTQSTNKPILTHYPGITMLPMDSPAEHGFSNQSDQVRIAPNLLRTYFAVGRDLLNHPDFPADHFLFTEPSEDSPDGVTVARERIRRLALRAFRGPVTEEQVAKYLAIYTLSREAGNMFPRAMRHAVEAILCSPRFLMRIEQGRVDRGGNRRLREHELASRISFFLWTSIPDERLLQAAGDATLSETVTLEDQVRRMLRDKRVKALSEHFGGPWLHLVETESVIPDPDLFPRYYLNPQGPPGRQTAGRYQMIEALLLFETIMVENRSILEFVDCDFTWLSPVMERYYGYQDLYASDPKIPNNRKVNGRRVRGQNIWHRRTLPDRRRGGVLTLASTLTSTSLPTRTSPIVRGAWVADVIFNRPPPPPPADVPDLADATTDTRGRALTLRERLELHSRSESCRGCHRRIDPPGYALEHYDAIGLWRDRDGKYNIDSEGHFADGRAFEGPLELKERLLERPELFARAFVEKMLSYALTRKLSARDDPIVTDILHATEDERYRFHDIVLEIVKSEPFRNVSTSTLPGNVPSIAE